MPERISGSLSTQSTVSPTSSDGAAAGGGSVGVAGSADASAPIGTRTRNTEPLPGVECRLISSEQAGDAVADRQPET